MSSTSPTPSDPNALSRRALLARTSAVVAASIAATELLNTTRALGQTAPAAASTAPTSEPASDPRRVELHWLDTVPSREVATGATVGVAWPRGLAARDAGMTVVDDQGATVAAQHWPLAYWNDGSVKWTAHAIAPAAATSTRFTVQLGDTAARPTTQPALRVDESPDRLIVDTGAARWTIARSGEAIIERCDVGQRETLRRGRLVLLVQDAPVLDDAGTINRQAFVGQVERATIEQNGPVRAVIKLEGVHVGPQLRRLLPFSVRLYFYAGSPQLRVVHTFIYDADESKDFIAGSVCGSTCR